MNQVRNILSEMTYWLDGAVLTIALIIGVFALTVFLTPILSPTICFGIGLGCFTVSLILRALSR